MTEQELQELVSSLAMFVDELPEMPTLKTYIRPRWAFEGGRAANRDLRKIVQEHQNALRTKLSPAISAESYWQSLLESQNLLS
jgi:hypothetical protein